MPRQPCGRRARGYGQKSPVVTILRNGAEGNGTERNGTERKDGLKYGTDTGLKCGTAKSRNMEGGAVTASA